MQQDALCLFFFCDYRENPSYLGLLRSLIRQASSRLEELPLEISHCYERHRMRQTQPDHAELASLLRDVIKAGLQSKKRVYVVIDALDELEEGTPEACRRLFLAFQQLIKSFASSINVMVTGRRTPDLEYEMANVRALKFNPPTSMIEDYVKRRLRSRHLARLSEIQKSSILDTLTTRCEGRYVYDCGKDILQPIADR